MRRFALIPFLALLVTLTAQAAERPRFTERDEMNPYYPNRTTPRLITPQWVGEEGVECVIVLAIDDMRDHEKYETFLRPILNRLKKIDGRAPLSIMTCQIDPKNEHLQKWLKEGVSLETHTFDHPCPLLKDGDFAKAKATYDKTVDLLCEVPNSKPVAFRTPCCDSLNTVSPRFFAEIFHKTTEKGNFLTIDSSVFNLFTANDPELPRELVTDSDGSERFRKYLPDGFVNLIEDYPYPYVIGRGCWEFPCVVPSDWAAQHYQKPANPITLRDWKVALDATVIKKGVFCLVFHPYGWSTPEQHVDLIDYAVKKYGKKVKFLTFREAQHRLDKNALGVYPLRNPKTGADEGVSLTGFPGGKFMSVAIDRENVRMLRVWSPREGDKPWDDADHTLRPRWKLPGPQEWTSVRPIHVGSDIAYVASTGKEQAVFVIEKNTYVRAKFTLPPGARLADETSDFGLRFVDLDEDGNDDVIFSNGEEYGIYLFKDMESGWSRKVSAGKAGDKDALPPIALKGKNNGFFVHGRALYWQNENTSALKDLVDRRSFNDLLASVEPQAKSPEASLKCLHPRAGFKAELMVSEPQVQSPIAIAWGADGKLWVVEMGDYPLGVDGKGKPGGRVKVLESSKGDGHYDKATVFLENLGFPTAVIPWRKGAVVICAPDIFYAEDTDGDGKADKREILYTGLTEGNQQHRANGLVWGVDGWLYCANGDSGGRVKSLKTGKVVDLRGRDFRIRPDTGDIDLTSGQSQYGRNCDDWGNWFGGNNSNPFWHFVLDDRYIRRNPHVAAPDARQPISVAPGVAPVYPVSRTLTRFNDPFAYNRFTSACSPIVYRDELFGPAFSDSCFVSEPVHNLVHREVLNAEGVTFKSRRAADEQKSEFLASSDNWFRPTMTRTGPDGALWVTDMYRAVIEHPEWIPKAIQKTLDLRAGHEMGRIYRVYPVEKTPRSIPRLDRLDTASLVAALNSPNGWQRDTVQQLLLWKEDRTAIAPLEKLATQCERPQARLQSLATLDLLDALSADMLVKALADTHPGVRRQAVRLGEGRVQKSDEVATALLKLVNDPDPKVRMQLAYSLGEWDDPRAGEALGKLALGASGDRFLMAAVMSSVNKKNLDAVLLAVLKGSKGPPPPGLVENLLRLAAALGNRSATVTLLKAVSTPTDGKYADWQFAALGSLLDSLESRNSSLTQLAKDGDDVKSAVEKLTGLFTAARATVKEAKEPVEARVQALRLLGRGSEERGEDAGLMADLLVPQVPDEVQAAALAALGRMRDERVPGLLLRGWKGYGPTLRGQALELLSRRDEWQRALLDVLEKQQVPPAEIDAVRRQRLLDHKDQAIRERAIKVFAGGTDPDRQKVIDSYRPVAKLKGDALRGQAVFVKTCAACHKLAGVGNEVGPDLATLTDKSTEYLLTHILDPNRVVEPRYVAYVAEMKSGLTITGVVTAETGNSITLVGPDGKPQTILRTALESLASSGKSPMPVGLEKDIPHEAMADLLAFLRGSSPTPKRKVFDGNNPETVKPGADGSLKLSAQNCAIYGSSLVFEKPYANLGYWSNLDDHAVWTVVLPRGGRYEVWLDYACQNGTAGNTLVLQAGDEKVTGKVVGTGTWDDYKQAQLGTLALPAGEATISLRSAGPIRGGALLDLKAVRLVPVK